MKRIKMKRLMKYTRKKAGAPKTPYDRLGNINKTWVIENSSLRKNNIRDSHATFVVDPKGSGTYCHITILYIGDATRYHYGFEVNNPKNRLLGKHFWTTPYRDDYKFTLPIKEELKRLYSKLCNKGENDIILRKSRSRSRRKSRSRSRKKLRSRSRSKSRRKSRSRSRKKSRSRSRRKSRSRSRKKSRSRSRSRSRRVIYNS